MLSKFLTRYSNLCQKYVNRNWMFLENVAPFQLQLLGPCYDRSLGNEESNKEIDFGTIFDGILMAVPKSKVSRSRKRMKWAQHIPEHVGWHVCVKCGEPKKPHRVCTKHIDVCALPPDQWNEQKHKPSSINPSPSSGDP